MNLGGLNSMILEKLISSLRLWLWLRLKVLLQSTLGDGKHIAISTKAFIRMAASGLKDAGTTAKL